MNGAIITENFGLMFELMFGPLQHDAHIMTWRKHEDAIRAAAIREMRAVNVAIEADRLIANHRRYLADARAANSLSAEQLARLPVSEQLYRSFLNEGYDYLFSDPERSRIAFERAEQARAMTGAAA